MEVRVVIHAPLGVQPLQHQLDGIDVTIRKVLVAAEKIFQEGDVLTQPGLMTKGCRRFRIVFAVLAPQLGLERIDTVLTAHQVNKTAAQVGAQVDELMLGI